jgi:hypothetical protein
MKRAPFLVLLATATGLLMACYSVSVLRLKDYESRPASRHVDVYASSDQVKRSFAEIAIVSVDDAGNGVREQTLVDALVRKAQEIGADGIILEAPQTSSGWMTSRTVTRAVAIIYK